MRFIREWVVLVAGLLVGAGELDILNWATLGMPYLESVGFDSRLISPVSLLANGDPLVRFNCNEGQQLSVLQISTANHVHTERCGLADVQGCK